MKRYLYVALFLLTCAGLAGCDVFGTEDGGGDRGGQEGEQGTETYLFDAASPVLRA